ncbi:MAG: S41 family peptidase [bacterium]|nr:S41 family peptidase [bacterium]
MFASMLRNPRIRHLTTALGIALVFGLGYTFGMSRTTAAQESERTRLSPEAQAAFAPVYEVFNLIQDRYIDPVDTTLLIDGAADGMIEALGDRYSAYMDPASYPLLASDLENEFEGIGVVITTNPDTEAIEIVGLLDDAPAGKAGLLPGDVFVAVDGEPIETWDQVEFATRVRGPAGTPVELTVQRGDEILDFTVIRERIIQPNVETELLADGQLAYLRLFTFTDEARDDFYAALETLNVNERQGLIIDVRDNPGGILTSAIDITSAFVREGVIVREDFGEGETVDFTATGRFVGIDVPIVVLINESSASASEILAGALQDFGAATLIGETTLGKGTVQLWEPLGNDGGLRLTIARWLTPNGRWIQDQGITPDILIEFTPEVYNDPADPQLDAAVAYLQGEPVESTILREGALTP